MKNIFVSIAFATGLLTASIAGAASLNLATTGPVSSGQGTADFSTSLGDPLLTIPLELFDIDPLGILDLFLLWEGDAMPDASLTADSAIINGLFYEIEEVGFTQGVVGTSGADDQIEFKLGSGPDFADGALFILTGQNSGFDFQNSDPLSVFSADLAALGCDPLTDFFCITEFAVNFSVQALDPGTPVIPLPAPLLLMGTAMAGFAVVRRRKA